MPSRTVQQPRAQPLLEPGHLLGGGRLADADLACSLAEGSEVHHANEEAKRLDTFHVERD
jgi:hypothetical protein